MGRENLDNPKVGNLILQLRKEKGQTPKQLAEKMNILIEPFQNENWLPLPGYFTVTKLVHSAWRKYRI
ncbi:hypothetical protein [Robertmurraya siralis]|uniref:hypothetical protein n=1 Tax=Robertmurraya siralis TaxID=77777 RepID=UPI001F307312|nr:hypothetical protein [Robertmurraya siralis]